MTKKFVVFVRLKTGEAWETTRHTKEAIERLTAKLAKEETVEYFTVETWIE